MQRIIGIEVEYGISSPHDPTANPILTSTQAVLAYAAAEGVPRAKRTRWDYEVESPLRDARGFDLGRFNGPAPIIDADEVGAANMILTNGARSVGWKPDVVVAVPVVDRVRVPPRAGGGRRLW
ncbi:proteasome accessory factor PafA2 family protein, partial [Rhodococcus chondri]